MRANQLLALSLAAIVVAAGCGGRDVPATVTPSPTQPVTALSLAISGKTTFTGTGESGQFVAMATFSDGSVRDVTSSCEWQTEAAAVMRVTSTGLGTAVAYGTTRVMARYQAASTSAFVLVRVTDVAPQVPLNVQALTGVWQNIRLRGDITRLEVRVDQARVGVRAWGNCAPTDCDWGEVSTLLSDGDDGVMSLTWAFGYAQIKMECRLLSDGRLEVLVHTHYLDGSGRLDHDLVDYLTREG